MKKLIWVLIVISLLMFSGCQPEPKGVKSYTDVSIDGFTVGIPADWEEEEADEEMMEAILESEGTVVATVYVDESDSAGVMLMVFDMKRSYELEGESW